MVDAYARAGLALLGFLMLPAGILFLGEYWDVVVRVDPWLLWGVSGAWGVYAEVIGS